MCKTWSITYRCEHSCLFRLSTCRGTFLQSGHHKSGNTTMVGCCSAPCLVFQSKQACGGCQRASAEQLLMEDVEVKRQRFGAHDLGPLPSVEHDLVEDELWDKEWQLEHLYPTPRLEKYLRPEKGQRTTQLVRPWTMLRHEVKPEEIILKPEAGWAEKADTGIKCMSLEEELAEADMEKSEEVQEYEAECVALMEKLGLHEADENTSEDRIGEMLLQQEEDDKRENLMMTIGKEKASAQIQDYEQSYPVIESRLTKSAATETVLTLPSTSEMENVKPGVMATPPHLRRRQKMTSLRSKASKQAVAASGCSGEDPIQCFRSSLVVA